MNTNQNSCVSAWISEINALIAADCGTFLTHDLMGKSILLEWQKMDGQSEQLTHTVKNLSDILVATYTAQELKFARMHPEAIEQEHFIKPLAPLFKDGIAKVDWNQAESQTREIFKQFFTTTDFAKFSTANEVHFFVIAKDAESGKILGFIQFMVTPEYAYGSVKAGLFGVDSHQKERGLELMLMSALFKLIPNAQRIFIHVRATNKKALALYHAWGFVPFDTQAHWINLEYITKTFNTLQKYADKIMSE